MTSFAGQTSGNRRVHLSSPLPRLGTIFCWRGSSFLLAWTTRATTRNKKNKDDDNKKTCLYFFWRPWKLKCPRACIATAFRRSAWEPADEFFGFVCFVCLCFILRSFAIAASDLHLPPLSNWITACCTGFIAGLSEWITIIGSFLEEAVRKQRWSPVLWIEAHRGGTHLSSLTWLG